MRSELTPWARNALTLTEQRLVRQAGISIAGRSPRGPWLAWGPNLSHMDPSLADKATRHLPDIRAAVNRAAGTELLKGER